MVLDDWNSLQEWIRTAFSKLLKLTPANGWNSGFAERFSAWFVSDLGDFWITVQGILNNLSQQPITNSWGTLAVELKHTVMSCRQRKYKTERGFITSSRELSPKLWGVAVGISLGWIDPRSTTDSPCWRMTYLSGQCVWNVENCSDCFGKQFTSSCPKKFLFGFPKFCF